VVVALRSGLSPDVVVEIHGAIRQLSRAGGDLVGGDLDMLHSMVLWFAQF
jgi:hypothetical protein